MGLNIKNDEAHRLAVRLSELTGKSMTAIVIEALEHHLSILERNRGERARVQELMMIGKRCVTHLRQVVSSEQHGDFLYDETGMPQ
ncbi:type II toxin-antitoxin system VapB family antitoxin [bacterium]|nr:type II toxin-antitoxin system VapB family antitoxin [bacterium]